MSIDNVNDRTASDPSGQAEDSIPLGTLTMQYADVRDEGEGGNKEGGKSEPISCVTSLYNRVLEYSGEGKIYGFCDLIKPPYFMLQGAPSALTLRFTGGSCWDGAWQSFRIELKTYHAITTTTLLSIDHILRIATIARDYPEKSDGVVAPGLRALSVYRAEGTGSDFKYTDHISCLHIYRSGA
jgi:hypothetical protein